MGNGRGGHGSRCAGRAYTRAVLGAVFLLTLGACTGSIDSGPAGPDGASGAGSALEWDADRYFAGQHAYDGACAVCHGVLEDSVKRGRTREEIDAALESVPEMKAFARVIDGERRDLIAYALSVPNERVVCPDTVHDRGPQPLAVTELVNRVAEITGLASEEVGDLSAGYPSGYDETHSFDNIEQGNLIRRETVEGLMAAFESVAELAVAKSACANRACAEDILRSMKGRAMGVAASGADVDSEMAIYDESIVQGLEASTALRLGIVRLLMSPTTLFKYLDEVDTLPAEYVTYALSSRSPAPDELDLDARELAEQILSDDPFTAALRFGEGWTGTRIKIDEYGAALDEASPVTESLLGAMRLEFIFGFANALSRNVPVTDLLLDDTSWLNQELAAHYGVTDPAVPTDGS
ncbi:MAG: DUF1592 domain-containing protein, partial [Myxococcales bacterium]|nr:DUF1592 domain-containing protein [Myxococcales bacterium]